MDTLTLVKNAQEGNRNAFEGLIREFSRLVFARAFLITRDKHEAEDLTQETFFKAWDKISTLNDPQQFRAWILTITRNLGLDHKKKKRPELSDVDSNTPSLIPTPDHRLYQEEIESKILDAIDTLPDNYREPLILRYLEGYTYRKIQDITGLSEGALKGQLHRGLAALRKQLKPLYDDIRDKGNLHEEV